jgi:hypothetical protein
VISDDVDSDVEDEAVGVVEVPDRLLFVGDSLGFLEVEGDAIDDGVLIIALRDELSRGWGT